MLIRGEPCVIPVSHAQSNDSALSLDEYAPFNIPSLNSTICFAMNGSYSKATLENGTWNFSGLNLGDSTSVLPQPSGFSFGASAQNCNVTITRFNRLNVFPPMGYGDLEYTVSGDGTQMFNLHYSDARWLSYSVYFDGVAKSEGSFWNAASDGWLAISGISNVRLSYGAREPTEFDVSDSFAVPSLNGTIGFGGSGQYVFAELEDGVWTFQNLALCGVAPKGAPHWGLGASAQNCSVTVTGFLAPFGTVGNGWINYTVSGNGTQILNGNLDEVANFPLNYTVCVDGEERLQGDGWIVSDGGWVTVTGATVNVSIASDQVIPDWFWDAPNPSVPTTQPTASTSESALTEPSTSPATSLLSSETIAVIIVVFAVLVTAVVAILVLANRKY